MTMYKTLLLDTEKWDLVLDSSGNIALAEPPYALAQDVISAVRLFLGELWFDTSKGIPYFEEVLGHFPPLPLITSLIENAALTVPGVVQARCTIAEIQGRSVSGQIAFVDENGAANGVSF